MSATRTCGLCKTEYPANILICVRCGVNIKTGKDVAPMEPEEELPESPERSMRSVFPGLFRPATLIVGMPLVGVSIAIAVFGVKNELDLLVGLAFLTQLYAVMILMTGSFRILVSVTIGMLFGEIGAQFANLESAAGVENDLSDFGIFECVLMVLLVAVPILTAAFLCR